MSDHESRNVAGQFIAIGGLMAKIRNRKVDNDQRLKVIGIQISIDSLRQKLFEIDGERLKGIDVTDRLLTLRQVLHRLETSLSSCLAAPDDGQFGALLVTVEKVAKG